eukprot:4183552-Prymnesium_polylepis.1
MAARKSAGNISSEYAGRLAVLSVSARLWLCALALPLARSALPLEVRIPGLIHSRVGCRLIDLTEIDPVLGLD